MSSNGGSGNTSFNNSKVSETGIVKVETWWQQL